MKKIIDDPPLPLGKALMQQLAERHARGGGDGAVCSGSNMSVAAMHLRAMQHLLLMRASCTPA